MPVTVSPLRAALEQNSPHLVGVGRLAALMHEAPLPLPKPFGLHTAPGWAPQDDEVLAGHTREAKAPPLAMENLSEHCRYAVRFEFPWFPLMAQLNLSPQVRDALAAEIPPLVGDGVEMARRWWFAYELFGERLPLEDWSGQGPPVPFLPPMRFFCTSGDLSARHGVTNNLLGNRDFCPFVEKFAGAEEFSGTFREQLHEVLSPVCMMTMKGFLEEAGLDLANPLKGPDSRVPCDGVDRLVERLREEGFKMDEQEVAELRNVFGCGTPSDGTSAAAGLMEFARWLRGNGQLASRLRSHILSIPPADPRWHAQGELFLERMSRVSASMETRASQMIEGELPPESHERFFVDALSEPMAWQRGVKIDNELVCRLQRGTMAPEKFEKTLKFQASGEPRRTIQNFVSSEKYDEFVGKEKVLHLLPPPPDSLEKLLSGFFACLDRMVHDTAVDPVVAATIAKIGFNTLHPLVDGNGRVQRALFQIVLYERDFLPNVCMPVSVVMLRDRGTYELIQQKHVDQFMSGVTHQLSENDDEEYTHGKGKDNVAALYQYQDFTFALNAMMKMLDKSLPVTASMAYFLQRYDFRVDKLLEHDPLLPEKAATRIAKVFRRDGDARGLSLSRLASLVCFDGWWIGFRRILSFLRVARMPDEQNMTSQISNKIASFTQRLSGSTPSPLDELQASLPPGAKCRWVRLAPRDVQRSLSAVRAALEDSHPGDIVVGVHYPLDPSALVSRGLFPDLETDVAAIMLSLREKMYKEATSVAAEYGKKGVRFEVHIGKEASFKPSHSLVKDAKRVRVPPHAIYIGCTMGADEGRPNSQYIFADYIVQNAPCDVVVVKSIEQSAGDRARWVGISPKNFDGSVAALKKAFAHSEAGDRVVAVHYPMDPGELYPEGLSSLFEAHLAQVQETVHDRLFERLATIAAERKKDGVFYQTVLGSLTSEPHVAFVSDVAQDDVHAVYVGYADVPSDAHKLVEPKKLFNIADHIMRHVSCSVVVVKGAE